MVVYKWILLVGVAVELLFVSGWYVVSFFYESNFWLNWGIVFSFDLFSVVFFFFGLVVSFSIIDFACKYIVDEKLVYNFFFFLLVFLCLMFLLVFSGNILVLFVGWEGVRLLSFFLISWWGCRFEAGARALQAVFYNRVGDAGLIMFLRMSLVVRRGVWLFGNFFVSFFFVLFFLGVLAKSSQVFFHPWLPNAMEGPTPVSSLLHSSTMVIAGVYIMMRAVNFFDGLSFLVFVIRLVTCILGRVIRSLSRDFKKVVAYSTTSQLGFMIVVLGTIGGRMCLFYMCVHSFFKAMIFIVSRVLIHMVGGSQDFRRMSLVVNCNKFLFFLYLIGRVVMIRFPFMSGFWIKDLIIEGVGGRFIGVFRGILFGFSLILTRLYSLRLYLRLFYYSLFMGFKIFFFGNLVSLYSFFRLLIISLFFGSILFFFFGSFGHGGLCFFDKAYPLFVICRGFLIALILRSYGSVGRSYLLYFNPIWHKRFSFIFYYLSYVYRVLDHVVMEYCYYGFLVGFLMR